MKMTDWLKWQGYGAEAARMEGRRWPGEQVFLTAEEMTPRDWQQVAQSTGQTAARSVFSTSPNPSSFPTMKKGS